MRHTEVQRSLYEYLNGELEPGPHEEIRLHIAACTACTKELDELRLLLGEFRRETLDVSREMPENYWNNFAGGVERRIAAERIAPAPRRPRTYLANIIDHMFFTPRPYLTAFGGALAILICTLLVFRWYDRRAIDMQRGADLTERQLQQDDSTTQRFRQYVSRSKMLLVGISNMKPVSNASYDIAVEQEKSRELIHEARYLKNQSLDPRAEKLIDDLQRILIELANMKEEGNAPNVEIIRGGMHQENLLFKIRMEEQAFNPPHDSSATY